MTKNAVVSTVVAAAGMMHQPRLKVLVSGPEGNAEHFTTAIADTGAQVCVAESALLKALGFSSGHLQEHSGQRDLANISLPTHRNLQLQHPWPLNTARRVVCKVSAADLPVSRRLQRSGPGTRTLPPPSTHGRGERERGEQRQLWPAATQASDHAAPALQGERAEVTGMVPRSFLHVNLQHRPVSTAGHGWAIS